jgi:DNA-binding FadR family transcriptional regulator
MSIQYQTIVTESIAKQIAERIREAIISGRLQVDERLPTEAELAKRFEVSRPTIREALKRLAAQNLIRSRRGPAGGTFVNRPSQQDTRVALTTASTLLVSLGEFSLEEIAEARLELEQLCGRLAVKRVTVSDLDTMAREIELQRDPLIADEAFCDSDVRFHRALVDATGNAVLSFVMFAVIEALQPVANLLVFRFRERRTIVEQHQCMLDALRKGDGDALTEAIAGQGVYLRERYAQARAWCKRDVKSGMPHPVDPPAA